MTKADKNSFTVGIVQEKCSGTKEENLARAIEGARLARKRGAEIICLSELFSSPYFCSAVSTDFFDLAETIPGPTSDRFQALARELGAVLIVPLFEKRSAGIYHNSAIVIDADGTLLGTYRKMHIPEDPLYFEKYYFTPGDTEGGNGGFHVFDTKIARVGILICWDQWFPEAARITALLGAEILFYPTAIGWHPREKAEFGAAQVDAWRTIQRAHAIANGIYVASVNRVGFEATPNTDGLEFFGGSFITDPFGRVLTSADAEKPAVLTAECSRALIEETRRNWPFLRDRRIDAYSPILRRFA